MKRFAIATLGCKVNQFDSQVMREELGQCGFREVPFSCHADVYIINTCTVTGKADYQSRQLMRRAHRTNPSGVIIVTGCYAEVFPDSVRAVKGVSAVLGNEAKREVASFARSLVSEKQPVVKIPVVADGPLQGYSVEGFFHHCRAVLKIQEGCNGACSYCILPQARGRSRSLSSERVLEQLSGLSRRGYQEVVLTGVHLGSYGLDLSPPTSLGELVEQIEQRPDVPSRIRLSSLEPTDLSDSLISAIKGSGKICPHLHIPLQSGDNEILSLMNRGYTSEWFRSLIDRIVAAIPAVCIGFDVIGGFPGEGEMHFQNTMDLIAALPVAYLHVFPFSPRPATPAFHFSPKVKGDEIRRRCRTLRQLGQKKRAAYHERFLHRRVQVLVEHTTTDDDGRWKSVSRNYIPVWVEPHERRVVDEIDVEITEIRGPKVLGRNIASGPVGNDANPRESGIRPLTWPMV
jgi:threonylcarbamoyladenosine tRNA methylthiotransferase MtaB